MNFDRIRRQLRAQLLARRGQEQAIAAPAQSAPAEDLSRLHNSYELMGAPLSFHRRVLGRLLLPVRWLVRELLTPVLARQTDYNAANVRLVDFMAARLDSLDAQLDPLRRRQIELEELLPQALAAAVQQSRAQTETIASRFAAGCAEDLKSHGQALGAVREQLDRAERLLAQLAEEHRAAAAELNRQSEAARDSLAQLRTRIAEVEDRVARRLERTEASAALFDYASFEDRFRGGEQTIKEHQRRYGRYFGKPGPVIDLGCGRGEFLELMREAGIPASGVDLSPEMIERCRRKGLDVTCADALEQLALAADGSLGGIFSAQVFEHLAAADAARLVVLAHRKLRPGGTLVVETLNPESLMVQYRWFWLDPTHVRLVHPESLRFAFEAAGFGSVQCVFLEPPEGPLRIPPLTERDGLYPRDEFNRATDYLNRLLFCSSEYYAVGIRAAAT